MKKSAPKLREYQITDHDAIETAFESFRAVLYQLPTGGGKSRILAKHVEDHKGERILILAHKRRLLTQLQGHMNSIGIKPGMLIAQREENLDSNVVIASIRTAVKSKRLEKLIATNWDRIIVDEARNTRTGSYDLVLDRLVEVHPQVKLLGVDATPYRKDKKRLDKHFQTMVVSCEDIQSLQEKGYLAKIRTFATPIGEIAEQVKEVANDYQQSELSKYMRQQKYLDYVVDLYTRSGEKRQAIVFAVDKEHSKALLETFHKKGYKKNRIARIDSDQTDAEIDAVYEAYENKEIDIIINVEMLTEGVDLPETGCIVGARPTKSLSLYLQMAGRGTRPKEDGSDLIVLDAAGWTEQFGGVSAKREWSLDPEKDPNDPRKKNRIVGKDKDGNLTTDPEAMDEFTELVEMTPEQYISQVAGGMEEAKKQNLTVDQKINKVKADLEELLHKAAMEGLKGKVSPFVGIIKEDKYEKDKLTAYYLHKDRVKIEKIKDEETGEIEEVNSWDRYRDYVVEFQLHRRELMFATLSADNLISSYNERYKNKDEVKRFREMSQVAGQLNAMVMDNKNLLMQILEKYQTIHDLEKSKINLEEYKDLKKKFEAEQWNLAIAAHAKAGHEFEFNELNEDDHFKGYSSRKIVGLQVPSGSIVTYHNTIKLKVRTKDYDWKKKVYNNQDIYEDKKYVKGEKIYEILQKGGWKPVTK